MASTPVLPQAINLGLQNFVQGVDSVDTYKTLLTAGSSGTKVTSVIAANTDSISHLLTLAIDRSGTQYLVGAAVILSSGGTNGSIQNLDLLSGGSTNLIAGLPLDNDGQQHLLLKSGDVLKVKYTTTLNASQRIDVIAQGSDL